jgi:hypothetical protein
MQSTEGNKGEQSNGDTAAGSGLIARILAFLAFFNFFLYSIDSGASSPGVQLQP